MGAYVVRTSSLNDKHSCQLFRMGLRAKTTPILTTPLIRSNMSCAGSYHLLQSCFSFFVHLSMANPSRLVAASFSSLALLSSSVSTDNLRGLLATTFSSLRLLSNSLSSPRLKLLRVARRCYLWLLYSGLILSLSFLCL